MVAAMPTQIDAHPSKKTVSIRDLRMVAFGLAAAVMLVMIAGAINDDSGSSISSSELGEEAVTSHVLTITASQSGAVAENTAATTTVLTVAVTDGPATGCTIASGQSDVDGDGNLPFAISAICVITVNDAGDLNYESTNSWTLTLLASDNSGASDVETVAISITDADEFDVGAPSDSNSAANTMAEDIANAATVGVTAAATDADGTTNVISYTVTAQSCANVFTVGSATGIVAVADNTAINYETATSCTVAVTATSTDTSTAVTTFTVAVTDIDEVDVGSVTDSNGGANTMAENVANDATVGLTAVATDADGTTT
jgi:hypothetical protein